MSRKVFIAFLAILALVCIVSCKQDVATNQNKLYGTWKGSLSYAGITESYTFIVNDDKNFKLIESFTAWGHKEEDTIDGTYEFTSDTEGTLTAEINDHLEFELFFDQVGEDKVKTIPFTLAGDSLTITDPEEYLSVILHRQ